MNLLITSPTWAEIKPLEKLLQQWDEEGSMKKHVVEIAVTGIGGVSTAFHLGKLLPSGNWDYALHLGICGSFREEYPIGVTVHIIEECFGDLGAEDDEKFIDVFEIGLLDREKFPFENGKLVNPSAIPSAEVASLPQVTGISVNKVHGNDNSITSIISKYHPDVESMEGAAFFYCCKLSSIPFMEIRTVSNKAEKRDRSRWDTDLAIKNLNETAAAVIGELLREDQLLRK